MGIAIHWFVGAWIIATVLCDEAFLSFVQYMTVTISVDTSISDKTLSSPAIWIVSNVGLASSIASSAYTIVTEV